MLNEKLKGKKEEKHLLIEEREKNKEEIRLAKSFNKRNFPQSVQEPPWGKQKRTKRIVTNPYTTPTTLRRRGSISPNFDARAELLAGAFSHLENPRPRQKFQGVKKGKKATRHVVALKREPIGFGIIVLKVGVLVNEKEKNAMEKATKELESLSLLERVEQESMTLL